MTWLQSLFVAVLQGATEMFPISSLGHAVVVPALLQTGIDQRAESFLPFIVMLHLGSVVALVSYFWRDWFALLVIGAGWGKPEDVALCRKTIGLIVLATIPAALVALLFEKMIRGLFATPMISATFLVVNGFFLLFGEKLRGTTERRLYSLTWKDALFIGCFQCLALIPGISRSGATIVAGLLRGINHAGAAHFSFLIATPIIAGATLHQAPKLLKAHVDPRVFIMATGAAVVSGVIAWVTTWILMRWFRGHDSWALTPFALYCIIFGTGSLGALYFMG